MPVWIYVLIKEGFSSCCNAKSFNQLLVEVFLVLVMGVCLFNLVEVFTIMCAYLALLAPTVIQAALLYRLCIQENLEM